MRASDVTMFLMELEARYPTFHIEDIDKATVIWYADLKDYSVQQVADAFKIYRATNHKGFAPSVDELIDCMHKVEDAAQMSAIEAWGCVSRAVRNSNYHAQEEFDKLPELIKKTVGSAGQLHSWAQTDMLVLEGTIAKQFQFSYESMAKREREFNRFPVEIQNQFLALNTQSAVAALPQWENPVPLVVPETQSERASSGQIDEQIGRLKELLRE